MPIDIIVVLVSISVLVLIHEVGHFLAARFFGVWVEEFGLGIPPKIFGKKIGETEYTINALPMGGFVKLHGEDEETYKDRQAKHPKRAFFLKPWWQRSAILTAGVLMNFLFALIIVSYLFTKGGALGIVLYQMTLVKKYPIYTAPFYGLKETVNLSYLLFKSIIGVFWDFISGFKVPKDVAGPIGMYQLYGEARKYGFEAILELSGLISLNLAVINLFPIPPLDGSKLLLVIIEGATGKKLKKEIEYRIYQASFVFLILLFLLISIQDIKRLFGM